MKIVIAKENIIDEQRIAAVPSSVKKLVSLGFQVAIIKDLGKHLGFYDQDYTKAGATIISSPAELYNTDVILQINSPTAEQIASCKKNTMYISMLNPFNEQKILKKMQQQQLKVISLAMVPRISNAQKMDVLSSQYNIAGYAAVMLAANKLQHIFPMLTTAAGTIKPVKVFVIGAAVAGLQAIATAKRLGAIVYAYDTRPEVEEQITSIGAKFVKLGPKNKTIAEICQSSNVVITTAQIFGKPAPKIINQAIIENMLPGSVIVDMAASSGGNVELTEPNKTININNVTIIGLANLPSEFAVTASNMFANNAVSFIEHIWHKKDKTFSLNSDDPITKSCLLQAGENHD